MSGLLKPQIGACPYFEVRIPLCPQRPHGHRGDGARVRAGGLDLGHSFDGAYRRCGHPGMEVADMRSFARGDAPIRVLL